ncbi:hypothetical protein Bca101_045188 [Brassica carinata]
MITTAAVVDIRTVIVVTATTVTVNMKMVTTKILLHLAEVLGEWKLSNESGNHDQGFNREDTATVNCEDTATVKNKNKNVNREDSNQEPEVEVSNFHDAKVIEKGPWFENKAELSWSIRMLSIESKFRIVVSKSDKKLLVVTTCLEHPQRRSLSGNA